ncbi:MAG TPA: hypothetical protein VGD77_16665 [Gemmatimonadaceae bacterium]
MPLTRTLLAAGLLAAALAACGPEPRSRLADTTLPDSLGMDALAAEEGTGPARPAPGAAGETNGSGPDSVPRTFATVYRCPGAEDFRFSARPRPRGDSLALFWVENEAVVGRSGAGSRYTGPGATVRIQGDSASFRHGATIHEGCAGAPVGSVWEEAAALGATFRAVGQEPGWMVLVHPTRGIRYIGQYGEERVLAAPTAPATDAAGTTTWLATTASGTIGITAEARACADGMSGEQMTHTVAVSFGGRAVHGCGRMLRPR